MKEKRLYGFDNLKFILIFLVVLGHLLEGSRDVAQNGILLRIIYSFHMPAFLFLTGYFAKFRPRKIVWHLLYPYLLFQMLYLLYAHFVLNDESLLIQFSFPYWLLWYLLATIVYELLIPMLEVDAPWKKAVILLLSVLAALYSGYDRNLGYTLSGARIVSFFPYFLLGFYCARRTEGKKEGTAWRYVLPAVFFLAVAGGCCLLCLSERPTVIAMYGSMPYETAGSSLKERVLLMGMAFSWIGLMMTGLLPLLNRRLPVISTLGKNTFPIYLLHGFPVRTMLYYQRPAGLDSLPLLLLLTAAVVLLCGNPITAWVFRSCLTGQWLERLLHRKKSDTA